MTHFAAVDTDDFVVAQITQEHEPEGPYTYYEIAERITDRPTPHHRLKWNGGAPDWIDPRPIDQARADKVAELSAACAAYIVAGFESSALGAPFTYPSTVLDQHNLNGLVTRSLYPSNPSTWTEKFWCADAAGVWERRVHTAAQLQQVGDEAITRITDAQAKCDTLIVQASAATADQLAAITWDSI